jgi:CHAD domain-containing protein
VAKAQQITERVGTLDPQAWLAEVLRVRFEEVVRYRDAALDPERIDGVHDMRVAIRRLRSVIRDFGEITDKFPLKNLRKRLKRLADSLGSVRDADVFITTLEKLSARDVDDEVRKGIESIMTDRREAREAALKDLEQEISPEKILDLESRFDAALGESLKQRGLYQVGRIEDAAERIISKCRKEFLDQGEAIYYPHSIQRLHRMRISGKHLRYAVELFLDVLGEGAEELADETKKMQGHLGDVHDCDVWTNQLRERALNGKTKKDKAVVDERKAAVWLMSEFQRRRTKEYRKALKLWTKWDEDSFWHNQSLAP